MDGGAGLSLFPDFPNLCVGRARLLPSREQRPARQEPRPPERFITMPIKFAILGDGAWGTAIGILFVGHPDHRVSLWSAREDNARVLRECRENVVYLPGVPIPSAIELTTGVALMLSGSALQVAGMA